MNVKHRISAALVLGVFALLSCGEPPAAPVAPPDASLLGSLLGGLLQCSPMPSVTATKTVGSAGGVIKIGPHSLAIPAGALSAPVTITATAPSGTVNRIRFQPQGLEFLRPASLTMSYANCSLLGVLLPKQIVYTDDALNILTYLLSIDNLLAEKVTGRVNHFSNYAIAR